MRGLRVVIVTGLSGSGKSVTIKALEDLGFFCADNLPVVLLPKFLELCLQSGGEISKVALVMDLRERDFLQEYPRIFQGLIDEGYDMEILFLEASDTTLVRRFQETRRPHPLADGDSILEGIKLERERLAGLRDIATWVIDTSDITVHQLKALIRDHFGQASGAKRMPVSLVSFGYRYGMPPEADLVMDVRFLPNPYFVPGLKELTGEEPEVADYVLKEPETKEFIDRFEALMDFLLPLYGREGKAYLTVAIGCTGGKHRSVVIANRLGRIFEEKGYRVRVRHRDAEKENG